MRNGYEKYLYNEAGKVRASRDTTIVEIDNYDLVSRDKIQLMLAIVGIVGRW